ncbi:MAG: phenylalanine--tRNA ligase subunit alpha, partial [Candidatus Omnitrophota bacterium]
MIEKLKNIESRFHDDISGVKSGREVEEIRVRYLGRKGEIASVTKLIPSLSSEDKAGVGRALNELKSRIQACIEEKRSSLGASEGEKAFLDVTADGVRARAGSLHPLTKTMRRINMIFISLGFKIAEGPEIETEYNNFEALNIPLEHPSRDAFDTFYVGNKALLRSHTSTVQIRIMKKEKPPIQAIMPGRVYRPDAVDASHSFMFHQVEGLMVDKGIKFSD